MFKFSLMDFQNRYFSLGIFLDQIRTKNIGPLSLVVLSFIGYKETNTRSLKSSHVWKKIRIVYIGWQSIWYSLNDRYGGGMTIVFFRIVMYNLIIYAKINDIHMFYIFMCLPCISCYSMVWSGFLFPICINI